MAPLSDASTLLHACTYAVKLITCTNAFMHLQRSMKTSSKNYIRLLRNLKGVNNATQKDSRNIFEYYRHVALHLQKTVHGFILTITTDAIHIKQEKPATLPTFVGNKILFLWK